MKPGEKREMAVVFYVDPKLVENSELDGVNLITLSYTFYPVRPPASPPPHAGEGWEGAAATESPSSKSGRI
jgi:cytochrome c oxidase assembly protein subunit 11